MTPRATRAQAAKAAFNHVMDVLLLCPNGHPVKESLTKAGINSINDLVSNLDDSIIEKLTYDKSDTLRGTSKPNLYLGAVR